MEPLQSVVTTCNDEVELPIDWDKSAQIDLILQAIPENVRKHNPVLAFYVVDAVLSRTFSLSVAECMEAWNRHTQAAERIWQKIYRDTKRDAPDVFREIAFGIHTLDYLLRQGSDQIVCGFQDTGRNFVIAIARSNMSVCIGYAMYMMAMCAHFKLRNTHLCGVEGHVFNMVRSTDGHVKISYDAGFEQNTLIEVAIHALNQEYMTQLRTLLHVTQKGRFRVLDLRTTNPHPEHYACEHAPSHSVPYDDTLAELLMESFARTRHESVLRNFYVLTQLYPNHTTPRATLRYLLTEQTVAHEWDQTVHRKQQPTNATTLQFDALAKQRANCANVLFWDALSLTPDVVIATMRCMLTLYPFSTRLGLFDAEFRLVWNRIKRLLTRSNVVEFSTEPSRRGLPIVEVTDREAKHVTFRIGVVSHTALPHFLFWKNDVVLYHTGLVFWTEEASHFLYLDPHDALSHSHVVVFRTLDRTAPTSPPHDTRTKRLGRRLLATEPARNKLVLRDLPLPTPIPRYRPVKQRGDVAVPWNLPNDTGHPLRSPTRYSPRAALSPPRLDSRLITRLGEKEETDETSSSDSAEEEDGASDSATHSEEDEDEEEDE